MECGHSVSRIGVYHQVSGDDIRRIDAIVIDAVRDGAQQRRVIIVEQGDRKSRGIARNAADRETER